MKLKKILCFAVPFILAIIILVSTPKSKNDESSAFDIKKENYNMDNYLEKNHSEIDTEACTGFNLIDEDINKNDVILAGEYSGVSKNYMVKLSVIKYLNKKHEVRYLIENIGYSQAYYINQYLKSGDESILKSLYINTGIIHYIYGDNDFNYKEYYDFWTEFRKYNLSLPDNRRIIVIGIGFESKEGTALKYLNSLIPENEPPSEIKPYIKDFRDKYEETNNMWKNSGQEVNSIEKLEKIHDKLVNLIQKLHKDMEANPKIYEKYLSSRYFDFQFVLDNIVNSYKDGISINTIDSNMYSNFNKIYANLPLGKYFGQLNMDHVYQNIPINMDNHTRFAGYLNSSESPVKGRVLSIVYAYDNCKVRSNFSTENGVKDAEPFDIDLLKNNSKSDITLFKLNGENSPFALKSYFATAKDDMHTTDYFKYIILIKNSEAANSSWNIMADKKK